MFGCYVRLVIWLIVLVFCCLDFVFGYFWFVGLGLLLGSYCLCLFVVFWFVVLLCLFCLWVLRYVWWLYFIWDVWVGLVWMLFDFDCGLDSCMFVVWYVFNLQWLWCLLFLRLFVLIVWCNSVAWFVCCSVWFYFALYWCLLFGGVLIVFFGYLLVGCCFIYCGLFDHFCCWLMLLLFMGLCCWLFCFCLFSYGNMCCYFVLWLFALWYLGDVTCLLLC